MFNLLTCLILILNFSCRRTGGRMLTIFFVLTCLVIYSNAHRKEKRLSTTFNKCTMKPLRLQLEDSRCRIDGHLPTIYGCIGYCRSATISLTDRLAFVPYCQCCQPYLLSSVNATLVCSFGGIERRIPIITARRCHCRKCF